MAQKIETASNDISSPALAFLGDSVFELFIRSRIVNECAGSADELNKRSKMLTNAKAQAKIAHNLYSELTEEETSVYKRGRNHKSVTAPRSCSISEYRCATGLEALFGFLYLEGRTDRIEELIDLGCKDLT